jgi:DNA-binding GntR family transcriptional regulator
MREPPPTGVVPREGDRAFHSAIAGPAATACCTTRCKSFWDSRNGPIFTRLGGYFETVPSWRAAIAEHEAVRDAIAARDADGRPRGDA